MSQRHVRHTHGRRQRGLGGVHRVVDENIFVMLYIISTLFLTENQFKMILSSLGTCWTRRRQRRRGEVHQVVNENIFCHVDLVTCWTSTRVSTTRTRWSPSSS